jgi:LPS-assembly protein
MPLPRALRRALVAVVGSCLLAVPAAVAQHAPPPGAPAPAVPHEKLAEDDNMHVRAEVQERVGKGHYRFRGLVDVVIRDMRLQANELDLYEEEMPDGKVQRRVEATGEVVFIQQDQRLSGTSAVLDLNTGRGRLLQARGFLEPGVFIEADEIERESASVYRIKGGTFSSCYQPHPRWSFSAHSAKVKINHYVLAKAVDFHILDVPTPLFLPLFYYPLREDQRSTGFLFPQVGHGFRGYEISSGFFWAMGRSVDQTFTVERFSEYGTGFGHEFRYRLPTPSYGNFDTYALQHIDGGGWDHTIDWDAVQALPAKVTARVSVHRTSSTSFQNDIQDNLDLASFRTERSTVGLSRNFRFGYLQFLGDSDRTFFPGDTSRTHERLPSLTLTRSPLRLGRTGVLLGYGLRAEHLGNGDQNAIDRYWRYDASTDVSRPFGTTFLTVTPQVQARFTRYDGREDASGVFQPLPLDRPYVEASVGIDGPQIARVFQTSGGFYSARWKHVIEPVVTFRYKSRFDEFSQIPNFDRIDPLGIGTSQLDYGLVQHFWAKRPLRGSNKEVPYELLTWTVTQSYYTQTRASQFDPNYLSSTFNSLGKTVSSGASAHNKSPIASQLNFRPLPELSTNFNLGYDVYAHGLSWLNLNSSANFDRVGFDVGWTVSKFAQPDSGLLNTATNTIRGRARLKLIPNKIAMDGRVTYDLIQKQTLETAASLRYDVQCCGFVVEYNHLRFGTRDGGGFSFRILLANIGAMTGFNSQDAAGPQGTGYGGRR